MANFVACFSSDGDSLSQWRAYADDGKGFAIGFDVAELRQQPIQMLDVLYDHDEQVTEMMIALGAIYLELQDRMEEKDKWFGTRCSTLAASSIAFKNPAWRDEKEVRCHHLVDILHASDHMRLEDAGGLSRGTEVDGEDIGFQARQGGITAYLDLPFEVSEVSQPIKEIMLGPKCPTGPGNVLFLLGNNGYRSVNIGAAGSAYR